MDALKWLMKYLKGHYGKIFFSAVLTVFHVAALFMTPYITGYIVDNVIRGGRVELLTVCIVLLISASLVRQLTWYIRQLLMEWVADTTLMNIRGTLFEKLQNLDFDFFSNNRTGELMARMTGDMESIANLIRTIAPYILQQVLTFGIGVFTTFFASPILGASLAVLVPFIVIYVFKLSKTNKQIFIKIREAAAKLNSAVQENISGNQVVKAYAKEKYEIKKFDGFNNACYDASMEHAKNYAKYVPVIHFFIQMFSVVVVLVGGLLVMYDMITFGQLTTVIGILAYITGPIQSIPAYINQFQQFYASTIKIRSLNSTEPKITTINKRKVSKLNGKVTFKNVVFKFDDADERVLKGINFTAEPGQTIAIIGPTGSGKTSLANLIPRFYDPIMGAVYIDDINVKDIEIKTLRKNVAFAMQDVFLFSDTIKGNIAYGMPNASMEDIIRVAKAADAHEFIINMPDGYDTIVGERGVGLSGGQKQRIALARALLQDASILVLDDTTSALDMETEHDIQETLKRSYSHMTTFVIAHRISSVKNADLILVLNQGRVIEWGKHETLIKKGGYYSLVYDTQYGNFNQAHPFEMDNTFDKFKFTKGGLL